MAYEESAFIHLENDTTTYSKAIESSLTKLLGSHRINISYPKNNAQITNLGELEQNNYSRQNIISIASRLRESSIKGNSSIKVLVLDGYYIKNTQVQKKLLGINLENSAIVAIFKPAIRSSSSIVKDQHIVEQSTILHEIGHALGLTNNGVSCTSNHEDNEHKAHCLNDNCVMNWQTCGGNLPQRQGTMAIKKFCKACLSDIASK
ncbi:MAG: hypothetical protein ACPGYY_06790 [Bacteroidia bacterium]